MTARPPGPHGPPTPEPSHRDKIKNALEELMQQKAEEKKLTRADIVAQKARNRQKQLRQLVQAGILLIVLIIAIMFALPRWREPFRPPEGERAEQDMRKAVVFAASLVDTYEARSGRLPGSFTQVGVALPGISYMRTGDSYLLSARVNGHDLAFRKGDDKQAFLARH